MNTNGTTGPIPIRLQNANPLLFTLQQDHMTIQPYWIMVLQLLALQLVNRLWTRFKYGVFLTTLEIGFFRWILWFQIKLHEKGFYEEVLEQLLTVAQKWKKQKLSTQQQAAQVVAVLAPHLPRFNKIVKMQQIKTLSKKLRGKFEFDLFDIVVYFIPILGHSIWYCYIQSSCIEAEKATPWNCYNAFGYRLYNYIFASYFSFLCSFIIKCSVLLEQKLASRKPKKTTQASHQEEPEKEPSTFRKIVDWIGEKLGFWSSLIVFLFTGALVLPYVFTNVIPMVFIYVFMNCIYFSILTIILFFATLLVNIPVIKKLMPSTKLAPREYSGELIVAIIFAFVFCTYPILLSTLYNYSQYYYYGEDYFTQGGNGGLRIFGFFTDFWIFFVFPDCFWIFKIQNPTAMFT